jgi:hypothetical protein
VTAQPLAPSTTPPLHEPGADIAEGACTPRVLLTCSACQRFVVFCHLNQQTIRDYVKLVEPRWQGCSGPEEALPPGYTPEAWAYERATRPLAATQRGTAAPGGEGGAT